MKATIDFDDALYRRLKVEAALRGRTVRDLVAEAVRAALDVAPLPETDALARAAQEPLRPKWFASLERYAVPVATHDLAAIRDSVQRGRLAE